MYIALFNVFIIIIIWMAELIVVVLDLVTAVLNSMSYKVQKEKKYKRSEDWN